MARAVSTSEASSKRVASAFGGLSSTFRQKAWIPIGNTCREDLRGRKSFRHDHCAQFIAALVFLHLYDGWNYLEGAFASLMRNDKATAGHLAYYAELRAAMSFLAANGVLTVNGRNYILTENGNVKRLRGRKPTHSAVWDYLKEVSVFSTASDRLYVDNLVCPCRIELSEWIREFTGSTAGCRSVFSSYVVGWGDDIKRFKKDRELRNMFSYTPSLLNSGSSLPVGDLCNIASEFWDFFVPQTNGRFDDIDKYILRRALWDIKKINNINDADFGAKISRMLGNLSLSAGERTSLANLLTQPQTTKPCILDKYKALDVNSGDVAHLGIFIRASFLLRVATAACLSYCRQSSMGRATFKPWIDDLFVNKGWGAVGDVPSSLTDMRVDIDDAVSNIFGGLSLPYDQFIKKHSRDVDMLSRATYIMLWGLDL